MVFRGHSLGLGKLIATGLVFASRPFQWTDKDIFFLNKMHHSFMIYHFNSETIYTPENEQRKNQNPDICINFEELH